MLKDINDILIRDRDAFQGRQKCVKYIEQILQR